MTKLTSLLLVMAAMWTSACPDLLGQNPGCDGTRYKAPVFASVKKTTVPYAPTTSYTGDAVTLQMDVYEPAGDLLDKRPVIVVAHGGSFMFGNKSDLASYCTQLAKQGYIAASIEYRLYPLFVLGYPDSIAIFNTAFKAVGDMKAAVRYFRDDASTTNTFRADTSHIFVGGYSAGAVTALHAAYLDAGDPLPPYMAALLVPNGGIEGNSGSASNRSRSSRFGAVINLSGGLYRSSWIDKGEVPMSSIHGTADATVPYLKGLAANIAYLEGSGLLHPQAQAVGVESLLTTVEGGGHTNIYEQTQYAAQLAAFWVQTTTLLERLTCETVGTFDAASVSLEPWACYPNPLVGDQLRLELPASVEQADMRVYDANGRLAILSNGVRSGGMVSFSGLPTGTYLVQVLDPKQPQKIFAPKPVVKN
ncbi:MAG TPA: alpha/beta hydrolase fold domain-containing protein [Saprospiraceae bacterium]|nr:alpha/beta hydrolase fold domain-containing protein [Saprospiraceae bacterium]